MKKKHECSGVLDMYFKGKGMKEHQFISVIYNGLKHYLNIVVC